MFKPSRIAGLFAAILVTLFSNVGSAQAVITCLDHGHVDGAWVKVVNGNLELWVGDHTGGGTVERAPADVNLKAKPASGIPVPPSPNPSCQGASGNTTVWILPQTVNDLMNGLLWLGWSAESISPGVVDNNQVILKLTGASPPGGSGVFCGFAKSGVTTTKVFDTSDGISAADTVAIPVGSTGHRHINWAFTTDGAWSLTFEVTATIGGIAKSTGNKTYNFSINSTC